MKQLPFIVLVLCALMSCSFSDIYAPAHTGSAYGQKNVVHDTREWTVLVYMAADNDLETAAFSDFNEIEAADYDRGRMNVLTLFDRSTTYHAQTEDWEGTRLYEMRHDDDGVNGTICSRQLDCAALGLRKGRDTLLDMADADHLIQFIRFAREYYPAKKYALVIWGHGTGYRHASPETHGKAQSRAVAIDDTSETFMEIPTLAKAIAAGMDGRPLDLLAFDTCFAATIEEAYELRSCARWFAGAEGPQPVAGMDYAAFFCAQAPAAETGEQFARLLAPQYDGAEDNPLSIINLRRVDLAFTAFDALCAQAANKITSAAQAEKLREAAITKLRLFTVHDTAENPVYVDVQELAELLSGQLSGLADAAQKCTEALKATLSDACTAQDGRLPLGVYFCSRDGAQKIITDFSPYYTKGSGAETQCAFVRESCGYVPTAGVTGTLLDKLSGNYFK